MHTPWSTPAAAAAVGEMKLRGRFAPKWQWVWYSSSSSSSISHGSVGEAFGCSALFLSLSLALRIFHHLSIRTQRAVFQSVGLSVARSFVRSFCFWLTLCVLKICSSGKSAIRTRASGDGTRTCSLDVPCLPFGDEEEEEDNEGLDNVLLGSWWLWWWFWAAWHTHSTWIADYVVLRVASIGVE